jgi:dimethylargininase
MPTALTRAVPLSIARCELTHLQRSPIDFDLAVRQHDEYEARLLAAGFDVVRLAPEPLLPDSVFVEDCAVVFDEIAVVTRPGAASRRPETGPVRQALCRYRRLAEIAAPGTLDGGDVLVAGRAVFVGAGGRSNDEGVRQLAAILAPFEYRVVPVATTGCLHLKSAATLASASVVLVNPDWVDPSVFAPLEPLPIDPDESFAANVVRAGGTLLHGAAHVRTRALLERRGFRVVPVDLGELAKAEGALTCCSVLIG